MKLVFIDLDGTLITRKNSEMVFGLNLLLKGVLKKKQIISYITFYFQWITYFGSTVTKKNKAYLFGLENNIINSLGEEYVQRRLKNFLRPKLIDRIEDHRRLNHKLFLLTGSLDCIAKPIAKILGINNVFATRCSMNNGYFSAAPPLIHPYASEKLLIAKELAKHFEINLHDSIAYADSIADLPLLLAVSQPIAVAPDYNLFKIAIKKKWEIIK